MPFVLKKLLECLCGYPHTLVTSMLKRGWRAGGTDATMSDLIKFRDYFAPKKYQVDCASLLRPTLDVGDKYCCNHRTNRGANLRKFTTFAGALRWKAG